MQNFVEKMLENFSPKLSEEYLQIVLEREKEAQELLEKVKDTSPEFYKKLCKLRGLLSEYWKHFLHDRYYEGFLCGVLSGTESGGLYGGKGFAPLRGGIAGSHGEYWESRATADADSRYDLERLHLENSLGGEYARIADRLDQCLSERHCMEDEAYWDEGMRTGIAVGKDAAELLGMFIK